MGGNLALVEVKRTISVQPAVFHEKDAARYVGMNRTYFQELVLAGEIPYFHHLNKPSRIYFKEDLDRYLQKIRMSGSESPRMSLKGAAK